MMKIIELQVDGFGLYHDFHLGEDAFSAPITVFYGLNEAGKSTLHAFIRAILFGFPVRGRRTYEPLRGGRLGGRITLKDPQGERVRIERHAPPKKGTVKVYTEQGHIEGEAFLNRLLGNVSAAQFENIFAFSHDELQRLETLHSEEISAYLYHALLGTGSVDLLDTERKMRQNQDELFKPRAVKPQMNRLLKALEQKEAELEQIEARLAEYAPLQDELRMEEDQLARLEDERREAEAERQRVRLVLEEWRKVQTKEEELHQITAEREILQADIADHLELLGPSWSKEKVSAVDLTIQTRDALLKLAGEKKQAEEALEQLQEESERALDNVHRLQEALKAEEERLLMEQPQKEVQGDIREEDVDPQAKKKVAKKKGQKRKQRAAVSAALAALIPAVLLAYDQLLGAVIVLLCLAYVTYLQFQKDDEERLTDLRNQQQFAEERLIKKQESERQMRQLERELDEAFKRVQAINRKKDHQEQLTREIRDRWQAKTNEMALPADISPDGLAVLLHTLAETKRALKREQRLKMRQAQCQAAVDAWKQNLNEHGGSGSFSAKDWQERLAEIEQRENRMVEEMQRRATRIGQLKAELEERASAEELALKRQEFEEMKHRFNALAKSWSINRIAEHLCTSMRRTYEEERQPEVLREAGRWMQRITSGRYARVIAPLGQRDFVLVTPQGERLTTKQLSRGTVEQLYLALRFALVQAYGKHVCLPVIMDDVFVHFDARRLRQTLLGLVELSRSRQILLFTCHEHVLRQIEEVVDDVHVIALGQPDERVLSHVF